GIFTVSAPLGFESATSYSTELADFDGDGDLDIAEGNDSAPNYLYINDGAGNFVRGKTFGRRYDSTRNIIVEDINQDGAPDILITNRGKENEICINDGKGNFVKSIPFGTSKDRKSTRLNSSHVKISYAVFCLKKKTNQAMQPVH